MQKGEATTMDKFNVRARFCCFRRETGLTIAAWLEAVGSILLLILAIFLACDSHSGVGGTFSGFLISYCVLNIVMAIFLIFGVAMVSAFRYYVVNLG